MFENVIVTGAEGFIGQALCEYLISRGSKNIVRISRTTISDSSGKRANFNLHNYKDTVDIIEQYRPKTIFHLAGESSITDSWKNPLNYVTYNGNLTKSLVSAVEKIDPSIRVIFYSSSAVYSEKSFPVSEMENLGPDSPYAMSKVISELETSRLMNHLILRPFSIVGSDKKFDALDDWITQILSFRRGEKNELRVGDIEVTRDFLSVQDAVRMTWELANNYEGSGIFNLGSGNPTTLDNVIRELLDISQVDFIVNRNHSDKMRRIDKKYVVSDSSKILKHNVKEPENTFRQTLENIYVERKNKMVEEQFWRKSD